MSTKPSEPMHFFIIGAQRSATTYLYHLLDAHPEVEMTQPVKPEPKFFMLDDLYERGLDYYKAQFFTGKPGARLFGEKSTSYCESEKAAQRIADSYPQAKILYLLRDPVDRAVSNYWFSVNNGLETLPMDEAFKRESERLDNYDHDRVSVSPFAYLRRGHYLVYLRLYERYFPAEQIKVIIHERLIGSPDSARSLYQFLGAASDFTPSTLHQTFNASEGKTELSLEVERFLTAYYARTNADLAQHLGLALDEWRHQEDEPA